VAPDGGGAQSNSCPVEVDVVEGELVPAWPPITSDLDHPDAGVIRGKPGAG
jgi:hypothetical protein